MLDIPALAQKEIWKTRDLAMPYAQAGDIKLYYEVHGDGPPVVLVPGLGADTRPFFNVVRVSLRPVRSSWSTHEEVGRATSRQVSTAPDRWQTTSAGLFGTLGVASADVATRWRQDRSPVGGRPPRAGRPPDPVCHRGRPR